MHATLRPVVRRLAPILAALSLAFVGGVAAPEASPAAQPTASPVTLLHKCKGSRYVHAIIGGAHKCLGSGQFCAKSRAREYRRYGFVCKPGSDGRYRLHRR
jgi:hypothetical protein